jgi:hypothetical protein
LVAAGLGTPILVSGTTALPEVTLGLGSYVESPRDVEAWISQIDFQLSANKRPTLETIQTLRKTHSPASVAQSLIAVLGNWETRIKLNPYRFTITIWSYKIILRIAREKVMGYH